MSSGGTSSLVHAHADHNLHCVLSGRKDFILIDPAFRDLLNFQEEVQERTHTCTPTHIHTSTNKHAHSTCAQLEAQGESTMPVFVETHTRTHTHAHPLLGSFRHV